MLDLWKARKGDTVVFSNGPWQVLTADAVQSCGAISLCWQGGSGYFSSHGTSDGWDDIIAHYPATQPQHSHSHSHFYFVWNPNGSAPKHRHPTEQAARDEAERLAPKHPGQEFIVLRSVATCKAGGVDWVRHD